MKSTKPKIGWNLGPIVIEDNIPVPQPPYGGRPRGELRRVMEQLQPGQSFEVPRDRVSREWIKVVAKRVGIKVVCLQVNCEGLRTWRIE